MSRTFRLAYANAIIRLLWLDGLLTPDERNKMMEDNEKYFLLG